MEDDREQGRGFRVTDRRRFTEGAEATEPSAPEADAPAADEPLHVHAPGGPAAADEHEHEHEHEHAHAHTDEPVNFSTFVLGLSTQALMHLGEIPDPHSGRVERDLGAAKQLIDILGILAEKTKNNLEQAEAGLLESALYDLRMRYVQLVRGSGKEGS